MKLLQTLVWIIVGSLCVPSLGNTNEIKVAFGASIANYLTKALATHTSETKFVAFNEKGLAANNILKAVDDGTAEVGISGNSWENMQILVKEKNLDIKNMDKIVSKFLGNDKLIFMTFKGGPATLSKDQLKDVLTGKIKNWKLLGSEDAPVQIVLPFNTPSTQKTISATILDGKDIFRKGVKMMEADEIPAFVAKTKGAISFGSPLSNFGDVNKPKHPEFVKPVTAITIGKPSAEVEAFFKTVESILK